MNERTDRFTVPPSKTLAPILLSPGVLTIAPFRDYPAFSRATLAANTVQLSYRDRSVDPRSFRVVTSFSLIVTFHLVPLIRPSFERIVLIACRLSVNRTFRVNGPVSFIFDSVSLSLWYFGAITYIASVCVSRSGVL